MIKVSRLKNLSENHINKLNECYDNADFKVGIMSKNYHGLDIKNNTEMITDGGYFSICENIIYPSVKFDREFSEYTTFSNLSRLIFSEYKEGMFYDSHNDCYDMGNMRSDWSCTLFLNDASEYEGGELMIDIGDREISYKLNSGEYVLYPTGFQHRVNKILSGKRRVCVFWVESAIFDSRIRDVLCDFADINSKYAERWLAEDPYLSNKISKIIFSLKRNFGNYSYLTKSKGAK